MLYQNAHSAEFFAACPDFFPYAVHETPIGCLGGVHDYCEECPRWVGEVEDFFAETD